MNYETWETKIIERVKDADLYKYAHSWELKYWHRLGYGPSQVAYVLKQRGPEWSKDHPWWERRE